MLRHKNTIETAPRTHRNAMSIAIALLQCYLAYAVNPIRPGSYHSNASQQLTNKAYHFTWLVAMS